jgi:hypothetical protein
MTEYSAPTGLVVRIRLAATPSEQNPSELLGEDDLRRQITLRNCISQVRNRRLPEGRAPGF